MTAPLPASPFSLLRVTYGMLLGVDDYQTLVGHPRGKHLLHQAWLHGPGVVWGLGVGADGHTITVQPGLAIDGIGRDLPLRAPESRDVAAWIRGRGLRIRKDRKVRLHVVATAAYQGTDPAPVPGDGATLADPLDPTATAYSRYQENAVVDLVPAPAANRVPGPFHSVRVLTGLDAVATKVADPDGAQAAEAARRIAALPPDEQPRAFLAAFREFAARDIAARQPAAGTDFTDATVYPVAAADAGVVLAEIEVSAGTGGTPLLGAPVLAVRRSLLPVGELQELLCGRGPGFDPANGVGGPQVIRSSLRWDEAATLSVRVTAALRAGSVNREAVAVSSVDTDGTWVVEDVRDVQYHDRGGHHVITVRLDRPPSFHLVRIRIRGTGSTPVIGVDGHPLAGVQGDPSAGRDHGRDAVLHDALLHDEGSSDE